MKPNTCVVLILLLFLALPFTNGGCSGGGGGSEPITWPGGQPLEFVEPEEVGYSSEKLEEAEQFAWAIGTAAVMAAYDGKVFFAWGNISGNFRCHSIRKPFLSALYGIYLAKGYLNLDATMEDLNIDDIPPSLTFEEKQAKVEHLLMSRSGVYHKAASEPQDMIDNRPERGSHPPDTFFFYNNWDFNTLGTIFEQETGAGIFRAFQDHIADVVGMDDFQISNCNYRYERRKSMHPAYHFEMSARDLARFGILYQKLGNWEGTQIIPEAWIDESTMAYSIADEDAGIGYGYMWGIILEEGEAGQETGYPGFFHGGGGAQLLLIIPDLKLVIVALFNTDFYDPNWDDAGQELALMILDAGIN
ncbi:MAG: serine hydrolase [Deltaproteobacteria bacterium]|jgi:CubicO group peptidase (beta-lactamase class C family)|nr:serine hydrolase [Deltaproteobacteria bacterium]